MAGNLTAQVRNIAEVTTAVANGDLSREDHGGRSGEILELKHDHTMVDQLELVRRRGDAWRRRGPRAGGEGDGPGGRGRT